MSEFSSALARLKEGFYNSLPVTDSNPGGLAADGHVQNFPAALQDVGYVARAMETWISSLGGDDLQAVADFQTVIETLFNIETDHKFYIDVIGGDDAEDGLTFLKAVQSASRLRRLLRPASTNYVKVNGNLPLDYHFKHEAPPSHLLISSQDAGAPATLTVKDSQLTGYSGGIGWFRSAVSITFDGLNIVLDSPFGRGLVNGNAGAHISVIFNNCVFSETPTNTATLLYRFSGAALDATFFGSSITPIAGKVCNGIASGVDPSTEYLTRSNLSAW